MKMNTTFFMENEVLNSSSYNNFFENCIILWENNEKKNFFFLGGGIEIRIFYVKTINNIIETSDGFAKTIDNKNYPIVFDYRPTLVKRVQKGVDGNNDKANQYFAI